ncbi:helix-turn-helix domain-containing protein [Serratia fonticola]|uniref:helix-turn-helix domain-containing protein n=1 Tax=Serratia fonticola TaxID=47917 RepID=UPI001415497A|nr:helix-turn-helix transcriptional regulator [Serratia fonticola]QIP94465.1 hypothetical protein HAP32_05093 [Serratia fonticola]
MDIPKSFYSEDIFFVRGLCELLSRDFIDEFFIIIDLDSSVSFNEFTKRFLMSEKKDIIAFASNDMAYYKAEIIGGMTVLDKKCSLQNLLGFFLVNKKLGRYKIASTLTLREKQVLRLIRKGKGIKAMASELGIKEKTFYAHRNNLAVKLRCKNVKALQYFFSK